MLRIYYANSLETLRDVLVEMIHREPLSDPFVREKILVQSPGMAQWLKLELAERMGIAANIDFPLPASFLWQVFVDVLDEVPERSVYNKAALTWILMRLLPSLLEQPAFAVLHRYCHIASEPLRLYQLCACIADLFDQYLVYRPDWIAAWEAGENHPADEDQLWQPILWRHIVADVTARDLPHWHRANMYETFFQALRQAAQLPTLPTRVFVFGISALPENYVAALSSLGEKIDVHLMIANPCRHYWGDIVDPTYLARLSRKWLSKHQQAATHYHHVGHPLLASMGKLGRDYLHIVQQLDQPEVGLFAEPCYDTLLHAVQSDMLELQDHAAEQALPSPYHFHDDDQSIQLHAAHSALREIEVLHDQLLALLAKDTQLKPRDIIVMMPDVASYAPYIDAVFGNALPEHVLPYAISDRSADQEIPLISSFLQLLDLAKSRFSAPQIIELLELPATQRAYGITPDSFEDIRHWVAEANISWGLDAQMRAELSDVAFADNSWTFGLDRLFSGYALGDVGVWQNTAPYASVSGLSAVALGQLAAFVNDLKHYRSIFTGERSLDNWMNQIHALLQSFYQPDEHDHEALALIHEALERLQVTFNEAAYTHTVVADILRDYLNEALSTQRASQRFLSGQINFCTLMPMRAIPFRVVCLIGMNDGAYPRSLPPLGFDLMNQHARKGDRSRRDDDRYLFLEALLSAKETLYLSYVGRSIADNSIHTPSVLISELLEYCEQAYGVADRDESLLDLLKVEHPLTAYSERYFDGSEPPLFSYNSRWLPQRPSPLASPVPEAQSHLPVTPPVVVDLDQLVRFFRSPARYFFEQHLQVYFPELDTSLPDEEPFDVTALTLFSLRERLLESALKGQSVDQLSVQLRAEGKLPVGTAGDVTLQRECREMLILADKLQSDVMGNPIQQSVDLTFDCAGHSVQLQGRLSAIYDATRLEYRASKSHDHHRFGCWIRHLAMSAMGVVRRSTYRGLDTRFIYQPVPQDQAYQSLHAILCFMLAHVDNAACWQPSAAWPLLSYDPQADEECKAAAEAFDKAQHYDPYLARLAYGWSSIQHEMYTQTQTLFADLLRYYQEDKA